MSETTGTRRPRVDDATRARLTRRVTLIGSAVDAVLGVGKITVGWLAHSQALIADGIHSLSDLATDVVVLFAAHHASAAADEEHPYGHERIETAATVLLGASLIIVGIGIGYDAVRRMLQPDLLLQPQAWAIWIAALSVIAKEAIYHYTMRYARRLRSAILEANAWHSRSDAISSLVVIAGLVGTMVGLNYVDAVAALVVAWMIARIGWTFALASFRELVDTGLDEDTRDAIRQAIMRVDGVGSLHELRTRRMGSRGLVDVHIILADPRVSVSEGHQISEAVRLNVIDLVDDVDDVMVHIDPEDDEVFPPRLDLPTRREMRARLAELWRHVEGNELVESIGLHYLAGKVHLEVRVPARALSRPDAVRALAARLGAALRDEATIGRVTVVTTHDAP